jgi:serine/threonine protein phosphatase PrpC
LLLKAPRLLVFYKMGACLQKPVLAAIVERHGSKSFRVGMAELNGWRSSMEDAHVIYIKDDWGFFGVLDGHGGAECSAWCARRLKEKLDAEGCPADDAAAKKMVLAVDQEFLDTQQGSGSTAAMCIVRAPTQAGGKWKLHVINAGDSRVLLSRADGKIIDGGGTDSGLTTDHKPDHPSEKERIYRCGGTVEETAGGCARVNGDLAVSRGFGDADYKRTGGPGQEDHPVLILCAPSPVHALGRTLLNPDPETLLWTSSCPCTCL